MDTLNYLKAVKDGQLHFADGSAQAIPHWGDPAWTHFFCVRHAEKDDNDPYDPELSAPGDARAEHLGRIMAEAGLDLAYTTPFRRAQLTAEPVQRRGHTPPPIKYEPGNQEEWLLELLPNTRGKKIMIVGHQNTIPQLLNQLNGGGFDFENIPNHDFGKFFVVATKGIGATEIIEVRY
ncbi:MAG: histidine phosphatase family protein [Phycisphaerae bacterium]|nr:histidine phosphatase family protein [Saprospiraceae bacterium]